MDIFSKAKGAFDVVTGGNITGQTGELVWKYPHNMITSGSILQVMPGQEAVFYKSGSSGFEILGPGEYPVDTKLIPFLQKIMNIPFGQKTPYTTHIWYVNKTTQLNFPWGTRQKILLEDPKFDDIMLKVGATGELRVEVINTAVMFEKLVGTMKEYTLADLEASLKSNVINDISGILQRYATNLRKEEQAREDEGERRSFIDMLGSNDVLSREIQEAMHKVFEIYGIGVTGCTARLIVEEDENFQEIKSYSAELFAAKKEARKRKIAAQAHRDELDTLGVSYAQDRQIDVMQTFAGNEGGAGANIASMGAGLGMMGVMAGQMQGAAQNMAAPPPPPTPAAPAGGVTCPSCGHGQPPAKFCAECGAGMEKKCPSCNAAGSPNQKFCNECGASMDKKCACGAVPEPGQKFCNECGQKL